MRWWQGKKQMSFFTTIFFRDKDDTIPILSAMDEPSEANYFCQLILLHQNIAIFGKKEAIELSLLDSDFFDLFSVIKHNLRDYEFERFKLKGCTNVIVYCR